MRRNKETVVKCIPDKSCNFPFLYWTIQGMIIVPWFVFKMSENNVHFQNPHGWDTGTINLNFNVWLRLWRCTWTSVFQFEVFIFERFPIYRLPSCAIVVGEISPLQQKTHQQRTTWWPLCTLLYYAPSSLWVSPDTWTQVWPCETQTPCIQSHVPQCTGLWSLLWISFFN